MSSFRVNKSLMQGLIVSSVGLLLFLYSALSQAVPYSTKQDVIALIDKKMRIDGIPGVSFAIVHRGHIEWAGALGLAEVEHAIKAHANTVYRSASLVKPLTATAVLQLHQAGKLDLDQPVWKYCSKFPVKPQVLTTRQLLTHTAGVRSYAMPWSKFEAELYSAKRYKSIADTFPIFSDDPLLHEPGSAYEYTSYGYNVLGCVIESIAGLSYEEYISRHILKPSAMVSTFAERAEDVVSERAGLYRRGAKGVLLNEKYVDLTNKIPSGGLLTTATDMARFAIAYMDGNLLSRELMTKAYSPVKLSDGSLSYYGMGWDTNKVDELNRGREMYHVGVTPGVTGIMYLYPETKGAVIVFANLYNVSDVEILAQSIGRKAGLNQSVGTDLK